MTREEALDFFNTYYPPTGWKDAWSARECAIEALEERKTGKWVKYNGKFYYDWICSECDSCSHERTDYCPMCGAKMGEQG